MTRPPPGPADSARLPSALDPDTDLVRQLEAKQPVLFLDYDGTLTPIVARPEDALMPGEAREPLAALASHSRCVAGIVSGRSLADLKVLANIEGLIHAGNHGMEIRGPGLDFTHPQAVSAREVLAQVQAALAGALAHVPGILVEDKGLTLSVHYRATPEPLAGKVDDVVAATAGPYVESGQLRLTRGKMVVEARPAIAWDKGKAIEKIHRHARITGNPENVPFPVYFGDDRTDEDGFRAVQDMGGLAVFVGESRQGTVALHQLDSPAEVCEMMRLILEEL